MLLGHKTLDIYKEYAFFLCAMVLFTVQHTEPSAPQGCSALLISSG